MKCKQPIIKDLNSAHLIAQGSNINPIYFELTVSAWLPPGKTQERLVKLKKINVVRIVVIPKIKLITFDKLKRSAVFP